MKRNMDLIRNLLLKLEASSTGLEGNQLSIDSYDRTVIEGHCQLLVEAGLAEGTPTSSMGRGIPSFELRRLTWAGHDFLDAAREPARWSTAKTIASKAGGVTLDGMKDILVTLTTTTIKQLMGGE